MAAGRSDSPKTTIEQRGDRELVISRLFDAPARIVFDAWTKPEFVRRWWAPASRGVTLVSVDADVRVGGKWRYVLKPSDQPQFAFYGEYERVTPPQELVYSSYFEPFPEHPVHVTVRFEARGERTFLTSHEVYPSAETLQMALASGMEPGVHETMDQLAELVRSERG